MKYSYTVPYGSGQITVYADTIEELHFEVTYVTHLNEAAEIGVSTDEAFPHAYKTTGGDTYVGFVRPDGAFVKFGKQKNPEDPTRPYFAYKKGYKKTNDVKYTGYQYVRDGNVEPAPSMRSSGKPVDLPRTPKAANAVVTPEPAPEPDEEEDGLEPDSVDYLNQVANDNGFADHWQENFCKHFGIERVEDLRAEDYEKALALLSNPINLPYLTLYLTPADLENKPTEGHLKALAIKLNDLARSYGLNDAESQKAFRHKLIKRTTWGRTESSKEMCRTEVLGLIKAAELQLKKQQQ